jgi:hypothetical protein
VECYIGYVFKCQSVSVSDDVVAGKMYIASSFEMFMGIESM